MSIINCHQRRTNPSFDPLLLFASPPRLYTGSTTGHADADPENLPRQPGTG